MRLSGCVPTQINGLLGFEIVLVPLTTFQRRSLIVANLSEDTKTEEGPCVLGQYCALISVVYPATLSRCGICSLDVWSKQGRRFFELTSTIQTGPQLEIQPHKE